MKELTSEGNVVSTNSILSSMVGVASGVIFSLNIILSRVKFHEMSPTIG